MPGEAACPIFALRDLKPHLVSKFQDALPRLASTGVGEYSGRAFPGQCRFEPWFPDRPRQFLFLTVNWLALLQVLGRGSGPSTGRNLLHWDQVGSPDRSGPAAPLCPPAVPASASQLPLAWLALPVSFHLSSSWAIHVGALPFTRHPSGSIGCFPLVCSMGIAWHHWQSITASRLSCRPHDLYSRLVL